MHQTTIRFSSDMWELLEGEAAELGVSAAQYIREATLARIMYLAGRRGDVAIGNTLDVASQREPTVRRKGEAVEHAREVLESSEAVWAQSRIARERARLLRDARHAHQHVANGEQN
jgi:hypothetical protein